MNQTDKENVCSEKRSDNGPSMDESLRTWHAPKLRRISASTDTEGKIPAPTESASGRSSFGLS